MDVKSNELVDVPVAVSEAALRAAGRADSPPPVRDQELVSRLSARGTGADLGAFDVDFAFSGPLEERRR